MAATGYTPILIYASGTTAHTPSASNLTSGSTGAELAINYVDGLLFYKDSSSTVQTLANSFVNRNLSWNSTYSVLSVLGTGAFQVPEGTTAQRPSSPQVGEIRYNTSTNQFEGYSGSSPSWLPVGGSTLVNDTSTNATEYPLFANATSGTATTIYTSSTNLTYNPSTGTLGSSTVLAIQGVFINAQTTSANVSIPSGDNGFAIGPFTVGSGYTLTVASGSRMVIL